MKKSKILLSLGIFVAFCAVLFAGCGKEPEPKNSLKLSVSNLATEILFNESKNLLLVDQNNASVSGATFSVSGNASVNNNVVTLTTNAYENEVITISASKNGVTSNSVTLTVKHKEATGIILQQPVTNVEAGTNIPLSTTVIPGDATRKVEFDIIEGENLATIENNMLKINSTANTGDVIKFKAKIGDKSSLIRTVTVLNIDVNDVLDLDFEQSSITLDTKENDTLDISAKLLMVDNEELENSRIEYSVVSGEENIQLEDLVFGIKVTPLKHGSVTIKATFETFETSLTINVIKPQENLYLSDSFDDKLTYSYAKQSVIKNLVPEIDTANGYCADYAVIISNNTNTKLGEVAYINGVYSSTLDYVTLSDNGLTINTEGSYKIRTETRSTSLYETVSETVDLVINNGVNVENYAQLKSYFVLSTDTVTPLSTDKIVLNITSDINVNELVTLKHQGDAFIYGNGFKVNITIPVQIYAHESNMFGFYLTDVNDTNEVHFENLTFNGNTGMLSTSQLMKILDYTEEQVTNMSKEQLVQLSYTYIIRMYDVKTETQISKTQLGLENVTFSNLIGGVKGYSVHNETLKMKGVKLQNLLAEGFLMHNSDIHIDNFEIINAAVPVSSSYSNEAAALDNDVMIGITFGNISVNNLSTGDSLFIQKVIFSDEEVNSTLDGLGINSLPSLLQAAIALKVTDLKEKFSNASNKNEIYEYIDNAVTYILKTIDGKNQFELIAYSHNKIQAGSAYTYDTENYLLLTDDVYTKPIVTDKEYVIIDVYEMVKDLLEDYSGGEFMQYIDEIGFRMVVSNPNYIPN